MQPAFEALAEFSEIIHLHEGALVKKSNSVERYFNILLKGSAGSFINSDKKYVCADLFFEGDLVMDYFSFLFQEQSVCEIVVFEPSTILRVPYDKFHAYYRGEACKKSFLPELLNTLYRRKYKQQIDILSKTAKQRYVELLKKNEGFHRVPLKYVASYLGVTPQSLSRIRGERL